LFDVKFRRAEHHLEAVYEAIRHAETLEDIERRLVDEPVRALGLASAALFREQDGEFRRSMSTGWAAGDVATLPREDALVGPRFSARPYALAATGEGGADPERGVSLPHDLARPVLAAPVGNPRRCFAVTLYSGHEAGTDLDRAERDLLGELARSAEIAYAQVESETLRKRIAALERELTRGAGQAVAGSPL
jgi:hypothetical protein